jgi:CHAT domain-containing protein
MATVFQNLGDFKKALSSYKLALDIERDIGYQRGEAGTLNNIGSVYQKMEQYDSAKAYFFQSLRIKEQINQPLGIARSYNNLGALYDVTGNFDSAQICFTKAYGLFLELDYSLGVCETMNNISLLHIRKSDEMLEKNNTAQSAGNLALAIDSCLKVLEIAESRGFIVELSKAYSCLFLANFSAGNMDDAGKYIDLLISLDNRQVRLNFPLLSEKEKEHYFKTLETDYFHYAAYAFTEREEKPELAGNVYNLALQNKGLLLKSTTAMRNAILTSGDQELIKKYSGWIEMKKRIAREFSEGKSTTQLESIANALEAELVKASTVFSDIDKLQKLRWQDVRQSLTDGEAAIEFVRFKHFSDRRVSVSDKEIYCALVIHKNSEYPEMIELFSESELISIIEKNAGNNLKSVNGMYGTQDSVKTALYNLIWKPLEPGLRNINTVFLSPDGLLHKISFSSIAKDKNIYLCDVIDMHLHSSSANVAIRRSSEYNLNNASLFGGIQYSSNSSVSEIWNFLEGTKSETEQIEGILKKDNHNVQHLTRSEATETRFKEMADSSQLLHIATHGFFFADPDENRDRTEQMDLAGEQGTLIFRAGSESIAFRSYVTNKNPLMRSGLVFANANDTWSKRDSSRYQLDATDDGILTAQEVATIDMRNTELVVLSACETGLGDIKGSEGVYGLQRAFKMAGVKYIIMSLWQVPDKETAEFMTTFYKNLTKTNDIRKSFNFAQQMMRKKYDPYYWGAFVLVE